MNNVKKLIIIIHSSLAIKTRFFIYFFSSFRKLYIMYKINKIFTRKGNVTNNVTLRRVLATIVEVE